jgi:hypothetical protein
MKNDHSSNPHRKNNKSRKNLQGAELDHLSHQLTRPERGAIRALEKTDSRITRINLTKASMSADKRAGFIFEEIHAGTFNASARKAGDRVTVARTGMDGRFNNDPKVDIRVESRGSVVTEIQAKCCRNVGRSAAAVAKGKYTGTERLVPADQLKGVKATLGKVAMRNAKSANPKIQLKGAIRAEAGTRAVDRICANGHSSKPIPYKTARSMAEGKLGGLHQMIATERLAAAAKGGGGSGALVGGTISIAKNLSAVFSRRKSIKAALKQTAAETTLAATRGAATNVASELLKASSKKLLGKAAAKSIMRGSAPMAIAGCVVDMIEDTVQGRLSAKKAAKNVGRAASAWAGAEGGATAGAFFGPVGALVGGIIGGLLGSAGFSCLFD